LILALRCALSVLFALICASAQAGSLMLLGVGGGGGGFTPSCSQSAAYIAAASGISSYPTFESAMDTFICGQVTDGTFALIDHEWVFTAPTQAIALTDLVQTNAATPSLNGNVLFEQYVGFSGDGSTGYIDSGVNLSTLASGGGNFQQNNAGIGLCLLSTRSSTFTSSNGPNQLAAGQMYGLTGTSYDTYLSPLNGAQSIGIINSSTVAGTSTYYTNENGYWQLQRTGSTGSAVNMYRNASNLSLGSNGTSGAIPSALSNNDIFLLAGNHSGTAGSFASETEGFFSLGASLSSGQITDMQNRLTTLMNALLLTGMC
jgi:hypothetical protein